MLCIYQSSSITLILFTVRYKPLVAGVLPRCSQLGKGTVLKIDVVRSKWVYMFKLWGTPYTWLPFLKDSWFLWFKGISTLFSLFNAKAILLEEQYWYYLTHSWEDKGVNIFPKGICPKVNVRARLEYELVYYDSTIHRFNHYTTRTPPFLKELSNPTHANAKIIGDISISLPWLQFSFVTQWST